MKNARVLMVTPNLRVSEGELSRMQPPLGLMIFAPMLIKDGHIVKIHDFALEGWNTKRLIDDENKFYSIGQTDDQTENVIRDFDPTIIAISVLYSTLLDSAKNIAKIAKKINKKIIVIVGGNCVSNAVIDYKYSLKDKSSNLPDHITHFDDENFDYAITGEAELSFRSFVNKKTNNEDVSKLPGLITPLGNKKYLINPPEQISNLDILPRPARHLVNMEGYFNIGQFHSSKSRSKRVLNVMCSRGCPERCTFCTTPEVYGQLTRWRSIPHIMDEIRNDVRDFKIGEIQFDDDTLTVNRKNLMNLCKEIGKLGIYWCTPNGTKVNYHQRNQYDMYKAMHDAGCYQVTLACESGVQRVLDKIVNKRLPVDTIYPAIKNAQKAGLLVHTFWILGFPGETYEEMQQTVDFAYNSGSDSFSFAILQPLAGTPLYRKVWKERLWWEGREKYNNFRNSLIKVDGFTNPEDFEKWVHELNIKFNLILKEKDPKKFEWKYGKKWSERDLMRQT